MEINTIIETDARGQKIPMVEGTVPNYKKINRLSMSELFPESPRKTLEQLAKPVSTQLTDAHAQLFGFIDTVHDIASNGRSPMNSPDVASV